MPTTSWLLQRELLAQAIGSNSLSNLQLLTLGRRLGELCRVGGVFHGEQAIGDELVAHGTVLQADRVVNDHIAGYISQVLTKHDDTPLNLGAVIGGKPTILVGLAGNLHVSGTDAAMRPGQGNVDDLAIHLERQGGLVAVIGGFNGLGLDLHHAVHIVFALKFVVEGTNNAIDTTTGRNTVTAFNGTVHQLNAEGALDGNFLGELNGELLASLHATFGTPVPLNTKVIPLLQRGSLVDSDVININRLLFISMSRRDVHHSRGQYQQHGGYKRVNFKTYGFTHCILLIFLTFVSLTSNPSLL